MKYGDITNNKEIQKYYEKGNAILAELGYTDHSVAHTTMVAKKASEILGAFNYDKHDIELVKIAGFLHDIGNVINTLMSRGKKSDDIALAHSGYHAKIDHTVVI